MLVMQWVLLKLIMGQGIREFYMELIIKFYLHEELLLVSGDIAWKIVRFMMKLRDNEIREDMIDLYYWNRGNGLAIVRRALQTDIPRDTSFCTFSSLRYFKNCVKQKLTKLTESLERGRI